MSDLLNQASLVMIPSGYKEDVVYSAVPTDGSGDLSFTRASNGTRINSAGLVEVCPWNLLQNSEIFTSGWATQLGASITANTTPAPNGTTTADTISFGTSSISGIYQFVTNSAGVFTLSVYAKCASGTQSFKFIIYNGTDGQINGSVFTVTTEWQRFEQSFTVTQPTNWQIVNANDSVSRSIFIWGAQLNISSTAKPYFPTTDRLNVPRLTYQNGGGGCPSLLLERQSTNQLTYSQDFTQTSWTKTSGLSITGNTTISPDGTQNAATITNISPFSCVLFQLASTSATTWTISFYAKKGTNKYLGVSFCSATYQATSRYQPVFNLDNGTLQTINQSGSNETNTSYSITAVGNGWYRLTATATFAAGADQCYIVLQSSNNTSYTPASGNLDWTTPTTGNYYLYGAQVEASSYPTSYIPTTSASATRVADSFSRNNIFTNGLITSSGGTWFVELINNIALISDSGSQLSIGTSTNIGGGGQTGFSLRKMAFPLNRLSIVKYLSGTATSLYLTLTDTIKVGIKWNGTTADVFVNGVKVVTATAFTTTNMEFLVQYTTGDVTKFISQMMLFPTPLTDAELASLTTI
jgi:hypothetical protein